MDFEGKRVIVTGGTRGIGFAISSAFAQRGAHVAMVFRDDQERANQTLKRICEFNPEYEHLIVKADLSSPEVTASAFSRCLAGLAG